MFNSFKDECYVFKIIYHLFGFRNHCDEFNYCDFCILSEILDRFSDALHDATGRKSYNSRVVFNSNRKSFLYSNNNDENQQAPVDKNMTPPSIPDILRNSPELTLNSNQQWLNIDNRALSCWPSQLSDKMASSIVYISACYNNFSDLSDWPRSANLQLLNLQTNRLSSCGTLSERWPALRVLVLAENQLSTLSGLRGLTVLEVLDIHNNKLKTLTGLSELPKLTALNAANNQLSSLKGVVALNELRQLNVADNGINQLEGVQHLAQLTQLDVSRNIVTQPKQLAAICCCQKLERLGLSGNPVAKHHSINKLLAKIPALKYVDGRIAKLVDKNTPRNHSIERNRKTKHSTSQTISNKTGLRRSLSGDQQKCIRVSDFSPDDSKTNNTRSSNQTSRGKSIKEIHPKSNNAATSSNNELARSYRAKEELVTGTSSAINETIRVSSRPCTGDIHHHPRKSVSHNGRSRPSTGDASVPNGRSGVTVVKGSQSLRELTSTGTWSPHTSPIVQIHDVDVSQFRTQLQMLPSNVQHLQCIGTNLARLSQLSWFPETLQALTIDPTHNPVTRSLLWPLYAVFCTSVRTLNGVPVSLIDTRRAQLVFSPLRALAARAGERGLMAETLVDTTLAERARRADVLLKSLRHLQNRLNLRAEIRKHIISIIKAPSSQIKCCPLAESIHGADRVMIMESARASLSTIWENAAQCVQNKVTK